MASRELNILVAAKGALQAARDVGKVDSAVKRVGASARRVGKAAAIGIGAGVGVAAVVVGRSVQSGLENLALLEDATSQVTAALKNTGQAGTTTANQVAVWANEIESSVQAAFDDKAIVSATATLIRFGKVTKQNIRPAMVVMTDLAAKTGSVESAATLLAKALADPAKAAGALKRAGVVLTKQQIDQIKAMVKAGKTAKAQALLLDLVGKATKGAAAASAGPYRDSLNILQDVTEDAQKALATGFLPIITKVRDILSKQLAKPGTLDAITKFGKSLAGGLEKLIDVAMGLPWDSIGSAFKLVGQGSKAALDFFMGLPPWVQTAVLTGWGLNKLTGGAVTGLLGSLASGLIKGVLGINAGVVTIKAGVVNGGGIPGAGASGGGSRAGSIVSAVGKVFLVGAAIGAFAELAGILGEQSGRNKQQAAGVTEQTAVYVKSASLSDMKNSLAGLEGMKEELTHGFTAEALAFQLNIDGVRDATIQQMNTLKAAIDQEQARLVGASNRTKDDISRAVTFGAGSVRDKIESAKIAQVSAANHTAAAARAAGVAAASAIRDKDLSVTLKPHLTANITLRQTISARNTYLRVGNIRSGGFIS